MNYQIKQPYWDSSTELPKRELLMRKTKEFLVFYEGFRFNEATKKYLFPTYTLVDHQQNKLIKKITLNDQKMTDFTDFKLLNDELFVIHTKNSEIYFYHAKYNFDTAFIKISKMIDKGECYFLIESFNGSKKKILCDGYGNITNIVCYDNKLLFLSADAIYEFDWYFKDKVQIKKVFNIDDITKIKPFPKLYSEIKLDFFKVIKNYLFIYFKVYVSKSLYDIKHWVFPYLVIYDMENYAVSVNNEKFETMRKFIKNSNLNYYNEHSDLTEYKNNTFIF